MKSNRKRWVGAVVFVFVVWHLFFLLLRNPLDLWWDPIKDWLTEKGLWSRVEPIFGPVDRATWKYGNFFGIDQGWTMFPPPLARSVTFLAARLEFTDGTQDTVYSPNEPNPTAYFRLGGWRQRKLEDYLTRVNAGELAGHKELPLWEAYVRWCIQRWYQANPGDSRQLEKVVLLKRTLVLPKPGEDPTVFKPAQVSIFATFDSDGRLQ
jgi:hypothetical protein